MTGETLAGSTASPLGATGVRMLLSAPRWRSDTQTQRIGATAQAGPTIDVRDRGGRMTRAVAVGCGGRPVMCRLR